MTSSLKTFGVAWLVAGMASYSLHLLYLPYDSLLVAEAFGVALYTTLATCLIRIPVSQNDGPQRGKTVAWSLLVLGLLFFGGNVRDEPTAAWTGLLYAILACGALAAFHTKGKVGS